jgi:hypothetical protein
MKNLLLCKEKTTTKKKLEEKERNIMNIIDTTIYFIPIFLRGGVC